ncbi:hypothetical protein N7481_009511 [Penicillium waksmanii]|uniref:uncharacterized protein n=1 Tax=Penicillium waksmanii TaxID=69791 RepID=UPI002546C563|nr:uncharacterized protein N7481_009511 [Penicillium waksmanii]KAJ5975804.1 hypothetical protein N7481_009511 [Penicillium waksmanii]
MKLIIASTAVVAGLMGMANLCPAPQALVIPIASAVLAGDAGAITGKVIESGTYKKRDGFVSRVRRDDPFASLPQPAANECKSQLKGVTVNFTPTGEGAYRIDNIPSACMTLSTVLIGKNPSGAVPTPLGSASLEYTGITSDELNQLQSTLGK